MSTEIIELKTLRQACNDWIVRLSDRAGWWMLPAAMRSAAANMKNMRPYRGNSAVLEDVTPSAVMGLAMCGYPVRTEYYEQARASISDDETKPSQV